MIKKRLSILGSTGSIGTQALEIVERFPKDFQVVGLSAKENLRLLAEQVNKFHPRVVSVQSELSAEELKSKVGISVKVVYGEAGLDQVSSLEEANLVLSALSGSMGLKPLLNAIKAGKDIALANKEPMVMAGQIIMSRARKKRVRIIPVDSEHSAIFQLLEGKNPTEVQRVILSASGGPFRKKAVKELKWVTVEQALKHPIWKMGKKISVDSATLMNKALELIEAKWLFNLNPDQLSVVIHPQGIVHSLVEMKDGVVFAQLSVPDMRIPIAYALFWPKRQRNGFRQLDLTKLGELTFEPPSWERFPALKLGFKALRAGGTLPAVMNASNEEAVSAFLSGKIGFNKIVELVAKVMEQHRVVEPRGLEEILEADQWARERSRELINA